MSYEFESENFAVQEKFDNLKRLALGDKKPLDAESGRSDVGELVYNELVDAKLTFDEVLFQEMFNKYKQYLETFQDIENLEDDYPSIAAAIKGVETFEQEERREY